MLGGTRFIGRHLVDACLAREHQVTIIHRGLSRSPFGGLVREVLADRRTPTPEARHTLRQSWDAVIDTCAAEPDDLQVTTPLLRDVGLYVLLSSCAVYSRRDTPLTELSPTIRSDTADPIERSGAFKLRCEAYLRDNLGTAGASLLVARLGLVIGPHDHSGRLAYWLGRALRGGDVLVPMDLDQPLQLIDARDVARSTVQAMDRGLTGVVNMAGPCITAGELLEAIALCADTSMNPCWVGEQFVLLRGVRPWAEIPLWLTRSSPERALMNVSCARAADEAGLAHRPLPESIGDCLLRHTSHPLGSTTRWLDRSHELRLLKEWANC
ncbi:SDR family oxidoreductase [Kitasatospora atroaurantiaca]|uniref:NAD-dependent epimerase/dehydratase family protein n=1 Tax=Kitasatospora atroaurantiaca TaxID=285545 RepID=UPI0011A72A54